MLGIFVLLYIFGFRLEMVLADKEKCRDMLDKIFFEHTHTRTDQNSNDVIV